MGAVQRLATVVVIGLVALSTVLVLYLADESSRIDAEEEEQKEAAIERGVETYISFCLQCHGPAGEGIAGPEGPDTGRIGAPLGGNTDATRLNQEGINSRGTPVPLDVRAETIRETIVEGRGSGARAMPAWGEELNAEQIDELVIMIQNVDWDHVYNEAIESAGGYPTPPPAPEAAQKPEEGEESGEGADEQAAGSGTSLEVTTVDIDFEPTTLEIAADTDVTVTLTNEGATAHDFSIDDLEIFEVVEPGETKEFTINAPAGGYEYYCSVPGHKEAGMVGALTVS